MQYPSGMLFNPDTVRNEMGDFWAVALSPVAINKFIHSVMSGWIVGSMFVVGIASWFLLKRRETKFALASIKIGAVTGLVACVFTAWTGDGSAHQVAQRQPMKLAAMEGLYQGREGAGLVGAGVLNPAKEQYDDGEDPFLFKIEFPYLLSFFAARDIDAFVPGVANLLEGGYATADGSIALSANEKIARGKVAVQALATYREAKKNNDAAGLAEARTLLDDNFKYFGYGYITAPSELVPNVPMTFYAFHLMVILGGFLLVLFAVATWYVYKNSFEHKRWLQWTCLFSIFLAMIAGQAGWIVAEVGRQPWAIQDILPVSAAISSLSAGSVQVTFFLFLALFTILLVAELKILLHAIRKGPHMSIEAKTLNN
jgi:cytochrome d ubiquinol oxidase subunit I